MRTLILGAAAAAVLGGAAWAAPAEQTPSGPPARQTLAQAQADAVQARADAARAAEQVAQLSQMVRDLQAERDALKARTAESGAQLAACDSKNVEAIKVGRALLQAYSRVGWGTVIASKEPLLGLSRVKLENLAQGYEDQLAAARFDPRKRTPHPAPDRPRS